MWCYWCHPVIVCRVHDSVQHAKILCFTMLVNGHIPHKIALSREKSGPHPIHCSLGPPQSTLLFFLTHGVHSVLSMCLLAYLKKHTSKLIFHACCLWPCLGAPLEWYSRLCRAHNNNNNERRVAATLSLVWFEFNAPPDTV